MRNRKMWTRRLERRTIPRGNLALVLCDNAVTLSSVSPYPVDIPAHFTIPLAGEEWRADSAGVQCLPSAAQETEHAASPSASLQ